MSFHLVFHVYMLKKSIVNRLYIVPIDGLGVNDNIYYVEVPVEILDLCVKRLRNKEVASIKVLWINHLVEGATREVESDMISHYPHLFLLTPNQSLGY